MSIVGNKAFVVQLDADRAIQRLFAFLFAKDLIQRTLSMIIPDGLSRVFVYTIGVILIFIAWKQIQFTLTKKNLLFFFFWTIYLFLSALLLKSEREIYISLIMQSVLPCFPLYFMGKLIPVQDSRIIDSMRMTPIAVAISYILYYVISRGNMYGNIAYSQWLGYALLPACCIAVGLAIRGEFFQIPFMIVLLWGVVASGARGPLVCVIFAAILMILGKADLKSVKWWSLIIICVLLGISVYSYYEEILYILIRIFNEMNISTRTLNALLTESFTQSSDRDVLMNGVWKGSQSNPLGTGLFRDRQFLRPYLGKVVSSEGTYAHNFFLECILQYGVIFGVVIIIIVVRLLIKSFFYVKGNKEQFICYVVLVSSGFFPLMVSGSYLQWKNFYLMIGYLGASKLVKRGDG